MSKYYIKYTDKSGDLSTIWVTANNEQDAGNQFQETKKRAEDT